MPWKDVEPMEEKLKFVVLAFSGRFTVKDLCEQFGVSRKIGHRNMSRYAAMREPTG